MKKDTFKNYVRAESRRLKEIDPFYVGVQSHEVNALINVLAPIIEGMSVSILDCNCCTCSKED